MTSCPASRSARAMTFAPRSWPSSPGLATTIRIGADISVTPAFWRLDLGRRLADALGAAPRRRLDQGFTQGDVGHAARGYFRGSAVARIAGG